ncbi:NADPH-dependent FMN reductase [Paenibacillus sp. N3.4]|uniref:NADPH-dependent FMN reductase n=1 Tax=Paenibacillus sp. N3.4 TaxID=2603222 RepID=UPI0028FCD8A8|nr:NADPH-dependent FMN reductase [Paenibacillus sp. N3.4]
MNILAISGSLRVNSSNTTLLRAVSKLAPPGTEVTIYEGIGELPHFNPDLDGEEPPAAVQDWRRELQAADGVIICTPEYANGVPGVLKNALDWIVSSGEFLDKPTAVISASPLQTGGANAHASLLLTLVMMTAKIKGKLLVPLVNKKINTEGTITDAALRQEVETLFGQMLAKS